jgi:predicted TPR repeat methyltransferase
MTAVYVRRLFDQHAPRFEDSLLNRLAYSAPRKLLDAITTAAGGQLHIASMLDLGCGTGLAGATFRPCVDRLVGVDLSDGMIEEAGAKGIYDRLVVSDLVQFVADETETKTRYDLIVAADVFVYMRDLAPVACAVACILAPTGFFAFTVETHTNQGVVLAPTLRYAHSEAHVRAALADARFRAMTVDAVSTRTENGVPVSGLLAIATPE